MRHADRATFAWLLFLGAVALGTLWALDDLKAWLGPLFRAALPVHTSVLGECSTPVEGEQLMIMVSKRGGKVSVEGCMFVGSTGTYGRRGGRP